MPCAFKSSWPFPTIQNVPDCQFGRSEADLVEFAGDSWCLFHLPMADDDGNPSSKADWDRETIRNFNEQIVAVINDASKNATQANLSGVVFPDDTQTFPGGIAQGTFVFPGASLHSINCMGAQFTSGASFSSCRFHGQALFNGAKFERNAEFSGATFDDAASFSGGQFLGGANFRYAKFKGPASFDHCEIGNANFTEAYFGSSLDCNHSRILGSAHFTGRSGSGVYPTDIFGGPVYFNNASFKHEAEFSNRRFLYFANFPGATFHLAPKFHNSKLHQDTNFTDTNFNDTKSDHAARAYRTLKLAMEKVRAWDEMAKFYALEQRSLRHRADTPKTVKVFSWLYGLASDYGCNFIWPLGWLAVLNLLSFDIFEYWINANARVPPDVIFTFTMEQVFRPFYIWTSGYAPALKMQQVWHDLGFWLRVAATFQSLLSLGLVTLFVLAVRRRFKMG